MITFSEYLAEGFAPRNKDNIITDVKIVGQEVVVYISKRNGKPVAYTIVDDNETYNENYKMTGECGNSVAVDLVGTNAHAGRKNRFVKPGKTRISIEYINNVTGKVDTRAFSLSDSYRWFRSA